jgi:hypothetical protein
VTRTNAKAEPDEWLDGEFIAAFANDPVEAVEWAFRDWRNRSPFFPAISDIREAVGVWKRNKREAADELRRREEQAETERRRAAGELIPLDEIGQLLKEVAEQASMNGPLVEDLAPRKHFELSSEEWRVRANSAKARLAEHLAKKAQ